MTPIPAYPHHWRFFRAGGFDQVRLDSGADLLALDELDQKLWVALACPVNGLEFDRNTLALIDSDKDGRVRAPELIAAVKWAGSLLKNPDDLLKESPSLPLAAINDAVPEGQTILNSARTILSNLGKSDAMTVSIEDTTDTARIFSQTAFNGDGIIEESAATDAATRAVINDIIATHGSVPDRSGKPGIDQGRAEAFFADLAAYDAWMKKSEGDVAVLPLGAETAGASAILNAVRAKIDDFFGRCRLAAFDARALNALNREEKEYLEIAARDLTISAQEVAGFPLAAVAASKALPLKTAINPAWAEKITAFHKFVLTPLLGDRSELTEAEWTKLCARFAAYDAWIADKAGATVEKLGLPRVREILASTARDAITALIARDKAEEGNANAIGAVDRLVRYHRDLYRLCINFVNFKDFYDRGEPAIFQAGTLYLDQRSCELCLLVEDVAKHATMAGLAGSYLAYVDCTRKSTAEKFVIVAAFTAGDSDNLMVGRNGLFYDRKKRDYDATITRIIENPISIRQAFWAPYKKLVRFIEEMVAKRAAAGDAVAGDKITAAAAAAANLEKAKAAAPGTPGAPAKKMDVGTVAAMGVAFGALGTAFATLAGYLSGLLKLPFWKVCLAILGLLLLVSGPAMVIAFLKLRKRNLGPILDANGWAVNAKARINVPFGTSLTGVPILPPGSQITHDDPFADRPSPWPKLAAFLIVLCFVYSLLNDFGLIYRLTDGAWGKDPQTVVVKDAAKAKADKPADVPAETKK
jgi:hypothetical protein